MLLSLSLCDEERETGTYCDNWDDQKEIRLFTVQMEILI